MNSIDAYAQDRATRALTSEREIKSQKTTSVKLANGIGKALKDSGIHRLYSSDEIETLRRAEQLIDRRSRALSKALKLKAKANKEREAAKTRVKADLNDRLFGSKSDDEIVITARALVEYTAGMKLGLSFIPTRLGAGDIEPKIHNVRLLKSHIVEELFNDYEVNVHGNDYNGKFDWEDFEALCELRLAQARFNPNINDRSEAALAL